MATIDLSQMPIRTVNEVIKGYGAAHQSIRILNPDAKHYIEVVNHTSESPFDENDLNVLRVATRLVALALERIEELTLAMEDK